MSMNELAIKRIQETAHIPELLEQAVKVGAAHPLVTLPDNYHVKSLESYMPNRVNYRAGMGTETFADFVEYCTAYIQEGTQCFIDADNMSAKTVFDLGTIAKPLHCEHTAKLNLKMLSAYKNILSINERVLDQRTAAEWIEDNAEWLEAFDSEGNKLEISHVSQAIRKLKLVKNKTVDTREEDFRRSQSKYDAVEIQSSDGLVMPAVLKFTCEPYNNLDNRCFELRHTQLNSGDDPVLKFTIKNHEKHIEDMAIEFKDKLIEALKETEIKTFVGSLSV